MIFLALTWLVLAAAFVGWGTLVGAALRKGGVAPEAFAGLSRPFWIGWLAAVVFVQYWSLVRAVDAVALCLLLVGAGVGFPVLGRSTLAFCVATRASVGWARWRRVGFASLGSLVIAIALAISAMESWRGEAYDTDLYHFAWVRWSNTFPAVPGLGNLHTRLATNSGFLLSAALIDHGPWDQRAAWILNGLVVVAILLDWLKTILLPGSGDGRVSRIFCLLTLPYAVNTLARLEPSLYYDAPTLLLLLAVTREMLRGQGGRWRDAAGTVPASLFMVWILAILSFSFKPIGAASLFVIGAWTAVEAVRRAQRGDAARGAAFRQGVVLLALPVLLLGGYLARNGVLSGWLLYPAPLGRLSVPWAMPRDPLGPSHGHEVQSVAGYAAVLQAWARVPGPAYRRAIREGAPYWFPRWRARVWHGAPRRLVVAGSAAFVLYLMLRARSPRPLDGSQLGAVGAMALASLAFWFWLAPDPRFGDGLFWLWFGVGVALLLGAVRLPSGWPEACATALVLLILWHMPLDFRWFRAPTWWTIGHARALPTVPISLGAGKEAFTVLAPRVGDRCGDADLPCTPYLLPELRMREPGNMRAGFAVIETP